MSGQVEPQQPQQAIGPSPLPEQWVIAVAQLSDGSKHVVVQIIGPAGTKVSLLPGDVAVQVGEQIRDAARTARSGLIIPNGPVVMPNDGPGHG